MKATKRAIDTPKPTYPMLLMGTATGKIVLAIDQYNAVVVEPGCTTMKVGEYALELLFDPNDMDWNYYDGEVTLSND